VHVLFAKFVKEVTDPAVAVRAAVAFLAFFALSAACWLALRLRGDAPEGAEETEETEETGTPHTSRAGLIVGTAVVVLLVAVPTTIAVADDLWSSPADKGYPAAVVNGVNVRDQPTTKNAPIDTLDDGVPVVLRCTATAGKYPWYELVNPHPGRYVSDMGLAFPDERRPPSC